MLEIRHPHHQQTIIIILIIIINENTQDGIVGPLKQGSELSLKCKSEGGGQIAIIIRWLKLNYIIIDI